MHLRDLMFSYILIVIACIIGAFAIKFLVLESYIAAAFLAFATWYFFGLACMGLNRIKTYNKNKHTT